MFSPSEIATDLLNRLLAGERGSVPMHLGMLLEKSSPLDSGDEHYRRILPPELATLRLSHTTSEEIVTALCAEIARNPDETLITTVAFSGSDLAIRTAAKVLTNPPRPLTPGECRDFLAILNCYLPYRLTEDPEFLPRADVQRVIELLKDLLSVQVEEVEVDGPDRSNRLGIQYLAPQLLDKLTRLQFSRGRTPEDTIEVALRPASPNWAHRK